VRKPDDKTHEECRACCTFHYGHPPCPCPWSRQWKVEPPPVCDESAWIPQAVTQEKDGSIPCPHCGHPHHDLSTEYNWPTSWDDESQVVECHGCSREFRLIRRVSVRYEAEATT
jgi:ribosomal protein L37E